MALRPALRLGCVLSSCSPGQMRPHALRILHPRFHRATANRRLGIRAFAASETLAKEDFNVLPPGDAFFPELLSPGASAVCIGIDPDISGAVAVLEWGNGPVKEGEAAWAQADLAVYDMPVSEWQMASRTKKQPCSRGLLDILRPYALRSGPNCHVRVALEVTTPAHMSGKHAWFNIGYSTGVFDAILTNLGIPYERIHASIWKRQMGLFKMGKPGSMALAHQLMPQAAQYLKRKKDHGRAEALLIAAWALGCRAETQSGVDATAANEE